MGEGRERKEGRGRGKEERGLGRGWKGEGERRLWRERGEYRDEKACRWSKGCANEKPDPGLIYLRSSMPAVVTF